MQTAENSFSYHNCVDLFGSQILHEESSIFRYLADFRILGYGTYSGIFVWRNILIATYIVGNSVSPTSIRLMHVSRQYSPCHECVYMYIQYIRIYASQSCGQTDGQRDMRIRLLAYVWTERRCSCPASLVSLQQLRRTYYKLGPLARLA